MGIISPPPGGTGQLPDIPVPNYTAQAQAEAAGMAAAGWWDDLCRKLWEYVGPGLLLVAGMLTSLVEPLVGYGLQILTKLQGTTSPTYGTVMQQTLSDLLGVEITGASFSSGPAPGGLHGPYMAIGQEFLQFMVNEMKSSASGTPAGGYAAAAQWLGHAIGFAVREGNVELILEALPPSLRFFEGLRGYGVNLAHALGLGRLTHEGLRSFMKILVADPLGYYLNDLYHPAVFNRDEIIKAWFRGLMTDTDSQKFLSWLGYDPSVIPTIRALNKWVPSDTSVVAGWRIGALTPAQYNTQLTARDVDPQDLQLFNQFSMFARAEAHLNTAIVNYITLLKNRWITVPQFEEQLQSLGVDPQEIKWAEQEVAAFYNFQSHELTSSEILTAYENGLVDLDYYTAWMTRWGYSPADQAVLQASLLIKQGELTTKEAIAAWRLRIACLNAKAKGQPVPPGFDANCNPTS